ncbi:HWE histidine kinase domain-containing protein [Roseomonas sp. 18066]|uniref:HWE histidine kinase domain-containing protein n=1 Tax=Roseomonas sp. 18066 TaxID=2681412 RepID=UPI001357516C|nr:HWE histidine kinase domain-containing protein [Roseomonas sp. 18066]
MDAGFLLAVLLVTLLVGLGTLAAFSFWERRVRRETSEALAMIERREAVAQQATDALAASERRHRALAEAGALALWRADARGRITTAEGWTRLTGQTAEAAARHGWLDMLHPDDRAAVAAAWTGAFRAGQPLALEFRARTAGGGWHWCRARGVPIRAEASGPAGPVVEWTGVLEDIDDRRRAEEERMLVAREVDHRAKNVLAVVQSIVRLARKSDPEAFARSVLARVAALGRAHDLLASGEWRDTEFRRLAEQELASEKAGPADAGRIALQGAATPVLASAVQPLAMVLHELATNATRHGSLAHPDGRVTLRWRSEGGDFLLLWSESGGPGLAEPPRQQGLGSRLIQTTVTLQLGGSVTRRWQREGLICELRLPRERVMPLAPAEAGHRPVPMLSPAATPLLAQHRPGPAAIVTAPVAVIGRAASTEAARH